MKKYRVEKFLEYLYALEKRTEAEGYNLEKLGYSKDVQKIIDRLQGLP